ncbi:hypothetical protein [Streptomyces sp. CA-106131]|uniref:hypothetical protein n=1 Tax=Streptomyces sp. CA-106131 TaxID=3240045 RepID=UPI003D8BD1F2
MKIDDIVTILDELQGQGLGIVAGRPVHGDLSDMSWEHDRHGFQDHGVLDAP